MDNINNNDEQSLVLTGMPEAESKEYDFMNDVSARAQEYGQKISDVAVKAKDFATEKLEQASDKFKELQGKDFSEIAGDAKEYAKKNPGQTLLIGAAVGLLIGLVLRGGRK
ncbi:MAG TPA: hypothetical protein VGO50_01385 [Pyrinomonadaceae bacterium]|jgi:ElaB/YqjD/DUF883 family membrane-anchored ribosome-binding protein|nr:hypothetical protein [Pyrinomonadaceae bacterium]